MTRHMVLIGKVAHIFYNLKSAQDYQKKHGGDLLKEGPGAGNHYKPGSIKIIRHGG